MKSVAITQMVKSLVGAQTPTYPVEILGILKRTELTWAAMPQTVCFRIYGLLV